MIKVQNVKKTIIFDWLKLCNNTIVMEKEFEEILTDFFIKYDKRQLRNNKPHKIAVKFKGNENEVIEHLCKKYNVDPKTIEGIDLPSPSQPPSDTEHSESTGTQEASTASTDEANVEGSDEEGVEEAETAKKPKSKKKMVIVVVILLAAAGAAGYVFKDKILVSITGTEQETPQENTEEADPVDEEVEKTEEAPEVPTDEQEPKEEGESEKAEEKGNDEGGSDEETSGKKE